MVWLSLHISNFWILLKIRPYDLQQALSLLAQLSVSTLRQVSPISFPTLDSHSKILNNNSPKLRSSSLPMSIQSLAKRQNSQPPLQPRKVSRSLFKFHCLPPILPTVPLWLFSSPNIILSLTKFPKRWTPPFVYRSHFQEIINSYTNPTICYTDGSKTEDRTGFAFSINNCTQAHCHRNTASSFITEL